MNRDSMRCKYILVLGAQLQLSSEFAAGSRWKEKKANDGLLLTRNLRRPTSSRGLTFNDRMEIEMADIIFNCPHCRQSIEAPPDMAGQLIECPSCKQTIEVARHQAPPARPRYIPPAQNRVCPFCKSEIPATAQKCKYCGEWVNKLPSSNEDESDKRILPLFLLWFFLGAFGAHAFYAGRSGQGMLIILMLITSFLVVPGVILICILLWD